MLIGMMSCPNLNSFILQQLFKNARLQRAWISSQSSILNRRLYSSQTKEIVIPKAIPRGPTDILEALASTVKRDPTAPHFKFHDDPYLIPFSNNAKRSYALAQEAGRKAANWIKQEHADLFQHRNAEPFIEAFAPVEMLSETTPITEDLLKKYISSSQIANAIQVYGKLESTAISTETKQSFLELVSFYNEEDQLSEDLIEERWFRAGMKGKDQPRKTWKNNGLAEKVFLSFEKKTPEAYCALICGMAKHGQASGAWEYFNQMLTEGFTPDLLTFNSILRVAGFIKEDGESKVQLIQETLLNMIHSGVKPDVCTLNAILETISRIPIYRMARERALQTLADFKTIGIKPSLGSYYFILKTFCREKGPVNNILIDIVNQLEKEMPPLQDLQDVAFFSEAMRVCNNHLDDVVLARRLHDILFLPQNQVLIGDSFKESAYYRNFLLLITRSETPQDMMETYRHLVPNIYTPEQSVFEAIIKALNDCSAVQYIPELWSDAVYMELTGRESIIELLLEALASGSGPDPKATLSNDEVDPVLATAKAITTHIDEAIKLAEEQDRTVSLRWTGAMLGNLTKVFLQYGDVLAANEIMIKVNTLKNQLSSFFPFATLSKFVDVSIERDDAAMSLMAVDYAVEMGYDDAPVLGQRIAEKLKLDEKQQQKLKSILSNVSTSLSTSS